MKKITFFLVILSQVLPSLAQEVKKDNISCSCNYKIQVSYPDVSEENELEGSVIVEYDIDSVCFASNPKIIQSLGPLYDKEALRVINLTIAFNNKCVSKCKFSSCKKRKVKFPMTFKKLEDSE